MTSDKRQTRDRPLPVTEELVGVLEVIQKRVLWLAVRMIHHANHLRPNPVGTKVGGHQASSASMATIMTVLYFHYLRPGDRVSVKPHASPVFHAIHYLLGQLPERYLTTLRAFGGLQAYPSRTKDPVPVDFSTGSVGLGAVAPAFAALAHRYAKSHFGSVSSRRFIAVIGDAELDEGNVWEAILDRALGELGNLLWIVDLNRQSLDRVVPGIRAAKLKRLFRESGWQVLEAKYGRTLQALFSIPGGAVLRNRIDDMSNEEYQALIRLPGCELRPRLVSNDEDIARVLSRVSDDELPSVLGNLGGHDIAELLSVLELADRETGRPTILFAYTIKGWGLPFAGHPLNHSMLLTEEQIKTLAAELGIQADDEWALFPADSAPGRLCAEVGARLFSVEKPAPVVLRRDDIPESLGSAYKGWQSTQQTFGRLLVSLSRVPNLADRLVTSSPDVSVSTNLSGWIAKMGVFDPDEPPDYLADVYQELLWQQELAGQHIELGISEMNLFMMLGMFGLSAELCGQHLIPIGTVYDPFVCRGLDALIYALYSGAKFIFAGTPSGISLSPEGGAHQSLVTPSIGLELPDLNAYEPCFGLELEWLLLEALRQCCDREKGRPSYFRLSTKPVDQSLIEPAVARLGPEELQRQVLAGGYRLVDWRSTDPVGDRSCLVHIAATGTIVPEAMAAARILQEEGLAVNVFNLTSPRRLFEDWKSTRWGRSSDSYNGGPFAWLIPADERQAPIITVTDGASHSLAWLGGIFGSMVIPLGVDSFGQSGSRQSLYRHYEIDDQSIVDAALIALNRCGVE